MVTIHWNSLNAWIAGDDLLSWIVQFEFGVLGTSYLPEATVTKKFGEPFKIEISFESLSVKGDLSIWKFQKSEHLITWYAYFEIQSLNSRLEFK